MDLEDANNEGYVVDKKNLGNSRILLSSLFNLEKEKEEKKKIGTLGRE